MFLSGRKAFTTSKKSKFLLISFSEQKLRLSYVGEEKSFSFYHSECLAETPIIKVRLITEKN